MKQFTRRLCNSGPNLQIDLLLCVEAGGVGFGEARYGDDSLHGQHDSRCWQFVGLSRAWPHEARAPAVGRPAAKSTERLGVIDLGEAPVGAG